MNSKKIVRFTAFLMLMLISAGFILSSCSGALKVYNDEKGNLTDKKNDRYYIYCNLSLRAAQIKNKIYAKGDNGEKLYEVIGYDPGEYISEDIVNLGIPCLFREQHVEKEPILTDFKSGKIYLTESEAITMQIGIIDNTEVVDGIINKMENGTESVLPNSADVEYDFSLNIASENHPNIYYVLRFIMTTDGTGYLFDRGRQKCVLSDDILDVVTSYEKNNSTSANASENISGSEIAG